MKLTQCIIAIVIMALSSSAFCAGNSGTRSINRVQTANNWFAIYPDTQFENPDNCEDTSVIVVWVEDFPQDYSGQLSMALSALMGGKNIRLWFNGCKLGIWGKTLPSATAITVYK